MKITKVAIMTICVALLAACCPCRKGQSVTAIPFAETQWQLVQMEGQSFAAKANSFTIKFAAENKVAGRGDCNSFMGGYNLTDGKLEMLRLASTMMMCPDQATESKYLKILEECDSYSIDGDMLMLISEGKTRLAFKPVK